MDGRADLEVLVPGWFICRQLEVTKQTLNWWVSSGKLTPAGRDGHDRPLYRYGDAVLAEQQTRRSGKSRRGATMHRRSPTVDTGCSVGAAA